MGCQILYHKSCVWAFSIDDETPCRFFRVHEWSACVWASIVQISRSGVNGRGNRR